jgi:dsRNA-specific ribonuclease
MASDNVHERARAVVQMYPLTVAARSRQYDAMRPVETPRNPPTNADLGLALICAAYANDTYGMEILLQHKNPEQFVEVTTEDGRTALMYAAYHGNVAIVSTLLTIKADLARQDLMGRTAMHYAAMANRPAVLGLLQRRGASPLVFDKADKKPSDYAMERGSFDLGKALAKECQDRLREATHKMHEAKRPGPILAPLPSQTQDTSFAVEETKTMQETTRGLTETQMTHTTEEKREGRNTTEERKVTLDTTEEKQVMPDTTEEKQVMQNTTEEKQMTQDTTEETQVTRDTTEEKQVARGRTNQATRKTPTAERKTLVAHDPPHRNPWSDTLPFPRTETSSIWLPYAPVEVGPEVFAFDYEWIRTIFNVHLLRAVYTNMPFEPKDQNIIKTVYTQGNYYVYQRPLEGVTAASPFPTKDFKTFVEHLLKRHGREVDKDSPIVEARPFDMLASNVLRPTHGSEQTSKAKDPVLQLVSDACHVLTFPLSVVNEMKCLPSVLWNLESYLLVHELRAKMDMKIPLEMLRTAITTASAQEKYSLERLEFLGDSFLKWATSVYLFDRFERYTEEQLTIVRSRYVGNSSLYARAKAKNLHRYIHAKPFAPTKWQPPGFPPTCITDDSVQILSPKLVADTVEALVGAAFLSGGVWMAKACMAWLKLPSDMTLAKESQTPGVTSDQDGPLPTFHQETNDYHQRVRGCFLGVFSVLKMAIGFFWQLHGVTCAGTRAGLRAFTRSHQDGSPQGSPLDLDQRNPRDTKATREQYA